jgi:hypothetical protein
MHIEATRLAATAEGGRMTDRNGLTEPPAEPRALLGVLYGVIEEAERYEEELQGTDRIHDDRELADFLSELRDETRRRAVGPKPSLPSGWPTGGPVNHRRFCPTGEPRLLGRFYYRDTREEGRVARRCWWQGRRFCSSRTTRTTSR